MRPNKAKAKLLADEPIFGFIIQSPMPALVEISAEAGMDYVFIDGEHGAFSDADVEHMCRAAETADITPIMRVPVNRPEVISKALDRGVAGVVVPHINTRADAEAVVRAARYAPEGQRGFAGYSGARWGVGVRETDPFQFANRNILVSCMVEEEEGVRNLKEILSVPGVDAINVGPGDLAQSMGFLGRIDHPKVRETVQYIVRETRAAGKIIGVGAYPNDPAAYRQAMAEGVRFFTMGLGGFLIHTSRGFLQQVRSVR
jgi:4-hydroxy-2-oxoheptanedioate aldolase